MSMPIEPNSDEDIARLAVFGFLMIAALMAFGLAAVHYGVA